MEQIFEPLRTALMKREYTVADLLDIIGGFAEQPGQSQVAAAMSLHASDIIHENKGVVPPYNELIAEAYRRVFFDEEKAAKYKTNRFCEHGPETMKEFVDHLIGNLSMDDTQTAAGSIHTSDARH